MGAQGTADLDFGAFPGKSDASVAVTGQAGIVAGSLVEAWLRPVDTADHPADEHRVVEMRVDAGNIVAATGFTIYGLNTNQLNEPNPRIDRASTGSPKPVSVGTRIWGLWKVAWVWN